MTCNVNDAKAMAFDITLSRVYLSLIMIMTQHLRVFILAGLGIVTIIVVIVVALPILLTP